MVGAIGGVGGFLLPNLPGQIRQASGSSARCFLALAVTAFVAAVTLRALIAIREGWRLSWNLSRPAEAVGEARIKA